MVKHIYKIVGLVLIFFGALFFFGSQMKTDISDLGEKKALVKESIPYIVLTTQGEKLNTLYGYSETLDVNVIRETITPLNAEKTLLLNLSDATDRLTRLEYRILDKETREVYEKKEIAAVEKGVKSVSLIFDYGFKTSTEYILDIAGTTAEGRKIHYYTRLKYYIEDSHLKEKLAFAEKFHKTTFEKSKAVDIEKYLEPDGKNLNTSLAEVDITSNIDLITYSAMSPQIVSNVFVSVKEYNMETACIQYNYFVKAATASGEEMYHIKEFYRVRYAGGQNFLLNYRRNMEAAFNPAYASTQMNQLKLGITREHDSRMLATKDNMTLFFSRDGAVYEYNLKTNKIKTVYQAFSNDASYAYRAYNEQDIRLLKIDKDGRLYFCAYGYFPRGEYEGDVAVVLYEYTPDGELHEMVYMPTNSSYQQLKEDFAAYGYVSPRDIYYFTVGSTVYSYNMSGKRLERLAEQIKSNSFMTMEGSNCYVWSSSLARGYGESITIYNLENDEKTMIYPKEKSDSIRLLGVIESNVVYGYVRNEDIAVNSDGVKIVPCYQIEIADTKGEVKKTFAKKGRYIQSIHANGNVINMNLCKKNGSFYEASGKDSILTVSEEVSSKFYYTSRVTTKSLTEWYIQLPTTFTMKDVPAKEQGPGSVYYSERFVRLQKPSVTKYYVHAFGQITGAYESIRTAIMEADRQMGVVVSSKNQVVWERSGSFLMNNIGGIEMMKESSDVSNLAACAYMVLKKNHFTLDAKELSKQNKPVYSMLAEYMPSAVNLKDCTLEQVLYFVSGNKAVIAMTSNNEAVVISGYTTRQLYLFNPKNNKEVRVRRSEYEHIFKNAGNRFISYMEE